MKALVLVSGLPGVGKSTIASGIASALRFPVIELDVIERPILDRGISGDAIGWSTYEALIALARQNLAFVDGLIVDAVGWTARWRSDLALAADETGARFRPIEVLCSDEFAHRERIESRRNDPRYRFRTITWEDVEDRRRRYWEPWSGDRLVLDTTRPAEELLREAVAYVPAS